MSHEARINDALKQLGEEFRLGMVAADEYRARRRMLIESWGERDATTSPGSSRLKTATSPQAVAAARAAGAAGAAAPKSRAPLALAIVAVLAALAAAAYFLVPPGAQRPAEGPPVAAPAPLAPQIVEVKNAADAFLARNVWDAESINAFLESWRQLAPADRPRALAEPTVRTLRHALAQNIEAEAQLVGPDAPPEAAAQLELLRDFARELGE